MEKLQTLVDTNTTIGDPIVTADGTTVIPVCKVSYGIAGGGTDFTTKSQKAGSANPFGGGAGASVSVTPMCFLVIKDGSTRMIPVAEPASTTFERIVDKFPEYVDKLASFAADKNKPE